MAMKSRFSDVQIPENLSWPEFVYERFDEFGDRTAIIDGASGHSYTFTQLKTLTEKFASSLIKRGFQKGDVLAIYLPNVPEYPIIFYGVAYTGGKVTTVNPLYTAEELERQLQDTQAIYLVTSPPFLDKAQKACKVLGKIRKIFVVGGEGSDDCEAVSSLLDDDGSSFPTECMVDKDDVVTMPYSSGTTGLPKGVMITHHSMIANTCIIEAAKVFVIDQSSVVMTILPFYHIYGQLVTNAPIVPPIILFLAKHPMVDKFDLTSVEEVTSGAAPMGKGLEEALIERMPKLKCVRQGFGMTEVLITHVQPGGERKSGSVGVLLPNLECKVAPAELEALLISHQKIDDAAVIGVPDEKAGELPKAFVVPKGDITPEEIADFIAQRVAPHKKLSGGVEFIEKIPKSASGKILRKDLRKRESERTDKS
ncbi:4-coumarate--CoA ligase 1 [Stylophora pistillata]|uniref:4-coumarate--CoA ligase 1 n=1 Tax=Stylophora pistillata TaxID=50429 RepID=A0A2B4R799_STYPI|nr:4-coumarate--CoA ligase 1 [Stylophora pistillata]